MTTGAIRFPREMSEQDALMWNVDSEPMLRSTTAAVTLLEAAPDPRLLRFRLEQAAAEIPRLRQRVVVLPRFISRPNWVRDPDFDLDYHLRRVRAPGDGSLESVFELAATLAMGSFDRSRPLWEFTVVEGLEAGRAALIQKLHHAVTDGIAGMLLMDRVYDREPGRAAPDASSRALPDEPEPDTLGLIAEAFRRRLRERPRRLRQQATHLLEAARTPLQSTRDTVRDALELAPSLVPPREPLSPIARARSSRYRFHGVRIDLESFRRAGRAHGCTINDAFLTAMTGALDRYHRLHGARADELRAMVPVNLRGPGLKGAATSGNRVALARVAMPVAERDPRKRMIEIHTRLRRELKRPNEAVADLLAGFGNRMPAALRRSLFRSFSQGNDFVASCVPGLPAPLYMAGARVAGFYMFGPTAGSALNATFFSYGSQASIALNVDPAAIPDHELLRRCTAEGLDEVGKLG